MKDYVRTERSKRDKAAQSYDRWYVASKGALFDALERDLFRDLVAGTDTERTLDLGSGTGRITEAILPEAGRVVASDLSPESLRLLAQKLDVPCAAADAALGLPFRSGTFDLITCCQVLPRLEPEDLEGAFAECSRLLRPGGQMIFSVYNDRYWRSPHLPSAQARPEEARRFGVAAVTARASRHGMGLSRLGHYKAFPLRRLKARGWLAADRIASGLPGIGARLASFTVYTLRRTSSPQPGRHGHA